MNRKMPAVTAWLLIAAVLYFFENNTGTRIVLAASVLVPLLFRFVPFSAAPRKTVSAVSERTAPAEKPQPGPEPGSFREYQPGDPVNRIHWKLSAKTGRLLLRQDGHAAETQEEPAASRLQENLQKKKVISGRRVLFLLPFLLLPPALLLLVPGARNGAALLCNRLFELSESVNPYIYERFSVPAGTDVLPAVLLAAAACVSWTVFLVLSRRRVPVLLTALAAAGFQVYFGVSLPAWGNVVLFAFLGFLLFPQPASLRSALCFVLSVLLVSVLVSVFLPGVDEATEAASERVRDRFSRILRQASETAEEPPAEGMETRHVNTRSLLTGENEARTGRSYRLVTVEEEQISRPHWIDYLKIVLLLLLSVALVAAPFVPLAILNARKKKARQARSVFRSANANEAVCAMFAHIIRWLRLTGHDAGNLLYREWDGMLSGQISGEYARRYARCAALFEEAAYSDHPMGEEARAEMLTLLEETEKTLYSQADRKLRFRLRYVECVCE